MESLLAQGKQAQWTCNRAYGQSRFLNSILQFSPYLGFYFWNKNVGFMLILLWLLPLLSTVFNLKNYKSFHLVLGTLSPEDACYKVSNTLWSLLLIELLKTQKFSARTGHWMLPFKCTLYYVWQTTLEWFLEWPKELLLWLLYYSRRR